MKFLLIVIILFVSLGIQLVAGQTFSHPAKYLLEQKDLGTDWMLAVIQVPPIPDELLADGVKDQAYQDINYFSSEGQILFHGGIRILEFSTFDNANSYLERLTSKTEQTFPKPVSSFLNQNANCMLSELVFFEEPEIDEFYYLLCLKFPHMIQVTLQENLELVYDEPVSQSGAKELIEEVGEKVLEKITHQSKTITESTIPEWIKNTMKWYVEGKVSEEEMINALQFLIKEGIIKF